MFFEILDKTLYLKHNFNEEFGSFEEYLSKFISSDPVLQYMPISFFCSGKKIRSILYFKFFTGKNSIDHKKKLNTIAIIEIIHTASIIHDDVVDNNKKRRTSDSFLEMFGRKKSILIGDYILIKAIKSFLNLHSDKFLQTLFLRECSAIAYGATLEQFLTKDATLSQYIRVASLKTSPLFKLSCFLGTYLSSNDFEKSKKAATFGTCFGILFQVQNDLDGYNYENFKDSEDYVEKNITFPIIILRDYFGYQINEFFSSSQSGYERIVNLIRTDRFRDITIKVMNKYNSICSN